MSTEREAFEEWMQTPVEANDDPSMWVSPLAMVIAWRGWQARAALSQRADEPVAWIPVAERMPKSGQTVLACYTNSAGMVRRIRAEWVAAKTIESNTDSEISEYDEATDGYYDPEGWYEKIDNWGDYSSVAVVEGAITHWMPLPAPPDTAIAQRADGPVPEWPCSCEVRGIGEPGVTCGDCPRDYGHKVAQAAPEQSLTMQMQQMCSDWGVYWRASDAHGVDLSREQALELLRFALGVEVEIKDAAQREDEPQPSAWMSGNGHPQHISAVQTATDKRLYGPWKPLYTAAPTVPTYVPLTGEEMDGAIETADWPKSFVSPFVMEKLRNIGLNVESLVVARMRGEGK